MSTPTPTQSAATNPQRVHWSQHISGAQSIWLGKRLSRLVTLAALSISTSLTTGCRPGAQGNASPTHTYSDGDFRWTITRLEGATPETQVGWLDNETVLFIGTNHSTNGSPEISGLYAWDRKSPAKLVLADAYRFCFDGSAWTISTGEPQPRKEGLRYRRYRLNPIDLTTIWIGPDRTGPSSRLPNPYTCKQEKHPMELEGRHWDALRPKDGYLDFGAVGSRNQEVALINPRLTTRKPLGFATNYPTGRSTKYSEFAKEYTVYDVTFSAETLEGWSKGKKFPIHVINPKGSARRIDVSPGPWSQRYGGDRSIEIIQKGLGISSKGGDNSQDSPSGVYLLRQDHTFTKLDQGIAESLIASPDGCGLAYIQTIKSHEAHLRVATLCPPPRENETNQPTSP